MTTATPPEIVEADLASLLLELTLWGVVDVNSLAWLDPPPKGALEQARELLAKIGALDRQGRISAQGRKIAALPVHPRLAHMILVARNQEEKRLACDLAAILAERDPLRSQPGYRSTDIGDRIRIMNMYRTKGKAAVRAFGGDVGACAVIEKARRGRFWRRPFPTGWRNNVPDNVHATFSPAAREPDCKMTTPWPPCPISRWPNWTPGRWKAGFFLPQSLTKMSCMHVSTMISNAVKLFIGTAVRHGS